MIDWLIMISLHNIDLYHVLIKQNVHYTMQMLSNLIIEIIIFCIILNDYDDDNWIIIYLHLTNIIISVKKYLKQNILKIWIGSIVSDKKNLFYIESNNSIYWFFLIKG